MTPPSQSVYILSYTRYNARGFGSEDWIGVYSDEQAARDALEARYKDVEPSDSEADLVLTELVLMEDDFAWGNLAFRRAP